MSVILKASPVFSASSPQQLLEQYETQVDEIGEELEKVTDYRWDNFYLRLQTLSSQVDQVGRDLIESDGVRGRIQDKLKKAEDLLKTKTIQYFDQQLEKFSMIIADKSPSRIGAKFSQCVASLLRLRLDIDQGIKNAALSKDEHSALKELDTKIDNLFSLFVKKLPYVSETSSHGSPSSSSSSSSETSSSLTSKASWPG
jgi:hypothetical protein